MAIEIRAETLEPDHQERLAILRVLSEVCASNTRDDGWKVAIAIADDEVLGEALVSTYDQVLQLLTLLKPAGYLLTLNEAMARGAQYDFVFQKDHRQEILC